MAHFVMEDAGQILVRQSKDLFSPASGEKMGTQPSIWLEFERGFAPLWAVEQAVKRFKFDKRPRPGSIGGADIPVETWCVYVDTVAWAKQRGHSDEIREKAEALLRARSDILEVFPPVRRPPWPNYDQLVVQGARTAEKVAERNLETASDIGVSIEDLIDYESATLAREAVLAVYRTALKAELEAEGSPEAIVVEA